jgi:hypothetical protein
VGVTTAADRPPLPHRTPKPPTIRRANVTTAVEQYTGLVGVRAVELALVAGEVARLVVHWDSGDRAVFAVVADDEPGDVA